MIPVNRQSGTSVGVIAQIHFFLDDIFPNSIGRPIFGNAIASRRSTMRQFTIAIALLMSDASPTRALAHAISTTPAPPSVQHGGRRAEERCC